MKNLILKSALFAGVTVASFIGLSDSKILAAEVSVVNNVYNLEISNDEYNRLLNLGFTKDQIINMDPEEFALNKDLEGEIVSKDTKFIKVVEYHENTGGGSNLSKGAEINRLIPKSDSSTEFVQIELTEEEFNRQVEQAQQQINNTFELKGATTLSMPGYSSYSTSYKRVTTTIISLGSHPKYRVKNQVYWKVMPKNRDFDLIGVAIDKPWAGNKGTEYGKQTWYMYKHRDGSTTTGSATYSTTRNASYWDINGSGYAVKMNLKNDEQTLISGQGYIGYYVKATDMVMYYDVCPRQTGAIGIDAYGRYAHAITKISPSIGFSVAFPASIGFSLSGAKLNNFEQTNKTQATLWFEGKTYSSNDVKNCK